MVSINPLTNYLIDIFIIYFQFVKFEKFKQCKLAMELGYGFPIGEPWITDDISPWPFEFSIAIGTAAWLHPIY